MPDDNDDNDLSTKKKKENVNKKKFNIASRLLKNKTTRKFILRFLPLIFLVLFLVGIALFIINGGGLIIGQIEEWSRGIIGNIQKMATGDDSAKIGNEEIVKLAQYLENMGYDTQAYGLGSPVYEKDDDGNTKNKGNGNVKTVVGVEKSVDGKQYLRSYIAAGEHTYCLAENSVMGFFTSLWDNAGALINGDAFTSNDAKSTGLIQIVGANAGEYKKRVSIDRDRKQFRVYSNAFDLNDLPTGFLGVNPIAILSKFFTGDDKIRWGEVYSYDLENWIGRYGRPKELFLALHLSTLMPDLTYGIATSDDFNTKVEISMIPINTIFDVSATKDGETIDGNKVKELYEAYCNPNQNTNVKDKPDETIPNSKWTYGEIDELQKLLDAQATAQKNNNEAAKDFDSVSEDSGHFTKYNLTDDQVRNIAKVCCREQGTGNKAGIAAEASLMANLFERSRGSNSYIKKGTKYSTDTIYDFVRHDDWFGGKSDRSEGTMDSPNGASANPVNDEAIDIVKQVLVKGKRTLPVYVVEHDSTGDLAYVITNGQQLDAHDHKNYVKDQTTVVQSTSAFGSSAGQWTFFCFPSEDSDPFGYYQADGSNFYYQIGLGTTSTSSRTPSISSDGTPNVPFVTGVNISREEFINKCKQARPNTEFVQYAGEVYDVCVKNNINPIFCATQGIVEQGWNSPDTAKGNFWGLGIFNGQSTSSYGSMDVASYTQAWCDNIKDRLKGGWGTLEESKRLHPYNSKFTGEIKTIYDVLANYAAPDGYGNNPPPEAQAECMIEYIDKPVEGLLDIARNTFGDEYVDLQNSYGTIDMLWPVIVGVKKHWFYNDIDFTQNVYRFAKDAKKVMEYKPESEDNILNKNNVDVKLNATLTSSMGMIYQVAEPEASGPNDTIMKLFDGSYYKYDGTTERAQYIAAAKAQDLGKNTYNFNGEEGYPVLKNLANKVTREKVSFDNSKLDDSLTAFGLLENMHTETSDYIYRNLKELMVARKYFSESDLTTDVKKIMLWPIQTNNQFTKWETETSDNEFGKIIYCDEKEKTVLAPFDGKITKIGNNEITIKLGKLNKESAKLLEEIYKQKDPYIKINRNLLTGMKLTIKGVKLKTELKKGDKIKRGDILGEVDGTVNGKSAIRIAMKNTADESISEDIFEYMAQEENSKYEEIFEKKQKATEELEKKKGIDISPLAYRQGSGSTYSGTPGQLDTTQAGNGSEGTFTSSTGIAYKCFKQGKGYGATGDGGWGHDPYGNGEIQSWGCGPTSIAIIASGLQPGLDYKPNDVARIIQQQYSGSYVLGFDAVKYGMDRLGMHSETINNPSAQQIQDLLRAGKVMILSVNKPPSIFPSTAGHFIAALDINLNGEIFIANCNANLAAPSGWYTPDQVAAGCNGAIVTDSKKVATNNSSN